MRAAGANQAYGVPQKNVAPVLFVVRHGQRNRLVTCQDILAIVPKNMVVPCQICAHLSA